MKSLSLSLVGSQLNKYGAHFGIDLDDRHGERQRSSGNDFTCAQRRIVRVAGEQFDEMAQRDKRAVEHGGATTALAQFAVAIKLGLERRQFVLPLRLTRRDGVAAPKQECAVQAIGGVASAARRPAV